MKRVAQSDLKQSFKSLQKKFYQKGSFTLSIYNISSAHEVKWNERILLFIRFRTTSKKPQ